MRRRSLSSDFRYEVFSTTSPAVPPVQPAIPLPTDNTLLDIEVQLLTMIYKDKVEEHEAARTLDIHFKRFLSMKGRSLLKLSMSGINIHSTRDILQYIEDKVEVPRRNALIEEALPMVRKVAYKMARTLPNYEVDELVSVGRLALVATARRYNDGHNTKFSTFAEKRVKGAIIDHVRSTSAFVRSNVSLINLVHKLYQQHRAQNPHLPREDMVPIMLEKVRALSAAGKYKSTRVLNDESIRYVLERIDGVETVWGEPSIDASQERDFGERQDLAFLHQALRHADMNDRQRRIIELYYFEDMTLRAIGEEIGISEARVSQLQTKALRKLRDYMTTTSLLPRVQFTAAAAPERMRAPLIEPR